MLNFLRKLVAPEITEAIGTPRIKYVKQRAKLSQADKARRLRLKRKIRARKIEARQLAKRTGQLFPPKQGNRRGEWSSARDGRWAALNGLPAEQS
jgi:hypothetical protein